jgi:hypothetical protein
MSAVNGGDGQAAQRLKRRDIGVRVRVISARLTSFGKAVEHLIRGVTIGRIHSFARIGQDGRFREMDAALAELVMAADMVEMGGAGDTNEGTLADQRHMVAQAEMAEASVDEQVAIAAVDMPDVAAVEGLDSRLVD